MEVITVGELKARFSGILEQVKKGQEIIISFGKQRKKVAVLIPYNRFKGNPPKKTRIAERPGFVPYPRRLQDD